MVKYLLTFLLLFSLQARAQKIYGTVFNAKGDLLPYASVTIKGTSTGASANNKAKFSFTAQAGTYIVVCQHIGFAKQEKTVTVKGQDEEVIFVLEEQKLSLNEVLVKTGGVYGMHAKIKFCIFIGRYLHVFYFFKFGFV